MRKIVTITPARRWDDRRVETVIGNLLRIGVLLAAAIVLAGAVAFLIQNGRAEPHYRTFRGESSNLRSVPDVARSALRLESRGIMQLGLLFLIATPIARVAFSAIAFALQRDRMYVVFTLIVLAILIYSLSGSAP